METGFAFVKSSLPYSYLELWYCSTGFLGIYECGNPGYSVRGEGRKKLFLSSRPMMVYPLVTMTLIIHLEPIGSVTSHSGHLSRGERINLWANYKVRETEYSQEIT